MNYNYKLLLGIGILTSGTGVASCDLSIIGAFFDGLRHFC